MPILVKIDQEMRPWECSQTDRQTDANRFYNLSHAICYSYGTDNKISSCKYHDHLKWRNSNIICNGIVICQILILRGFVTCTSGILHLQHATSFQQLLNLEDSRYDCIHQLLWNVCIHRCFMFEKLQSVSRKKETKMFFYHIFYKTWAILMKFVSKYL